MAVLKPYSERRFSQMTALSLTLCNVLYALIAATCLAAFGEGLQDNALRNLSAGALVPMIGAPAATAMSYVVRGRGAIDATLVRANAFVNWPRHDLLLQVRLGYFVSLVGSFVLTLYPLRHCVLEVALGSNFQSRSGSEVSVPAWSECF